IVECKQVPFFYLQTYRQKVSGKCASLIPITSPLWTAVMSGSESLRCQAPLLSLLLCPSLCPPYLLQYQECVGIESASQSYLEYLTKALLPFNAALALCLP
ncbi:hypothetical protein DUNSADRAFT_6510, partial [Dunaliella salina]